MSMSARTESHVLDALALAKARCPEIMCDLHRLYHDGATLSEATVGMTLGNLRRHAQLLLDAIEVAEGSRQPTVVIAA